MDDSKAKRERTRRVLKQRLESLAAAGVQQVRKVRLPAKPAAFEAMATASPNLAAASLRTDSRPAKSSELAVSAKDDLLLAKPRPLPTAPPGDLNSRQQLLAEIAAEVKGCTLCRELACTRTQTVFGVGSAQARVVFFGEAPGADEDRQGEPFVGRAGQLLTKIIEACGWQRSDVYIMNVLKCRPPDNRNPLPQEVENCRPFFERQFEILRPEYIVCVGTCPSQALLETDVSVGKLRGKFHQYKNSKVLVTYHPSYLLRNPSAKKYVWEDMQLLLKEMGLPIPKRSVSP